MAISTFHVSNSSLTIEEYIDHIDSSVDINDQDSVVESSLMLERLAQNKKLLTDVYNRELKNYCDETPGAAYSPSSAVLGRGIKKKFIVRANLWPPLTNSPSRNIEEQLFSYNIAHDHNFDFLTANYFGPGYTTEIWEYDDRIKISGFEGESVSVNFLERTTLHSGKQIFYRRCRDIHIQFPPTDFSVSINLMAPTEQDIITDQYYFDLSSRVLAGHPAGCPASRRTHLLDIAGYVGNEETSELLLHLAKTHPCQRSRATALNGAFRIQPLIGEHLDQKIANDKSYYVQKIIDMIRTKNQHLSKK